MQSFKQRHKRAVDRVRIQLETSPIGYSVFKVKHPVFDLLAMGPSGDIQILRVVADEPTQEDIRLVETQKFPDCIIKKVVRARGTREKAFREKDIIESVYFILNIERNAVKIGRSIDAKRRLSELRSQLFDKLELLKVVESDNPLLLERNLHERFTAYHIKGEWFNYSDEIKRYLGDDNG